MKGGGRVQCKECGYAVARLLDSSLDCFSSFKCSATLVSMSLRKAISANSFQD